MSASKINGTNVAGEGIQVHATDSVEVMTKRLQNVENKLARPSLPAENRTFLEQRRANLIKRLSGKFLQDRKAINENPKQRLDRSTEDIGSTAQHKYVMVDDMLRKN
jgi:hypothetical protein